MAHWLLIHGAASNRLIWTRQMHEISSVTRIELPWLKDSPPATLLPNLARWCLGQIHQPVVIMGHSMGGAIAQLMALEAPDMVEGLVLVGTGPRLPVNPSLIAWLRTDPPAALAQIARWSLAKNPDTALLEASQRQIQEVPPARALKEFEACNYFDVLAQLPRIGCRRILLRGQEDRMTPPAVTDMFHEAWPDMPVYQIPQAGHSMMLENPVAFNQALADIQERFSW